MTEYNVTTNLNGTTLGNQEILLVHPYLLQFMWVGGGGVHMHAFLKIASLNMNVVQ